MRLTSLLWLCLLAVPLGAGAGPATPAPAATTAAAAPLPPQRPPPALRPPGPEAPPPGQAPPTPEAQAAAVEGNPDWAETLERIAGSVVSIDVDTTRAFDTEWNATAQATGFVVDAERGLILTNRHVVTPGPVTAEATFLNREEVQLYPVYRDPVHDFGLYRYDPKKLRFIKPQGAAAVPGRRADRPRDPRGRQQRRRAAVDPRRHAGAPRPRRARVRHRQVQRLQHLLPAGGLRHLGRLLRLAGHRHPRPRRGAQRRRRQRRGLELLPAARARAPRAAS